MTTKHYVTKNEKLVRTIKWSAAFETGIALIDQQHQAVFEPVNELGRAITAGLGAPEIGRLLRAILQDIEEHFATEELLLKENDYPGYAKQQAEHEQALQKLRRIILRSPADHLSAAQEFHALCCDWLINHISGPDRAYAEFLLSKGVL